MKMQPSREKLVALVKELSNPLSPVPVRIAPRLNELRGVRAVLFDVYGTLFVSGSGEPGTAEADAGADAFYRAAERSGLSIMDEAAAETGIEWLLAAVRRRHDECRRNGIDYPEIDIRSVWSEVLSRLAASKLIAGPVTGETVCRLAVEYECRSNPVWPMPQAEETIRRLAGRSIVLGVVSNAQFYTPLLFEAFFGCSIAGLGFDSRICVWSWKEKVAKPSPALHRKAASALKKHHGIKPENTLYVGNDMLNDVFAAQRAGLGTALFAGDGRSLRLRPDDDRCRSCTADITVTGLAQLWEAVTDA